MHDTLVKVFLFHEIHLKNCVPESTTSPRNHHQFIFNSDLIHKVERRQENRGKKTCTSMCHDSTGGPASTTCQPNTETTARRSHTHPERRKN